MNLAVLNYCEWREKWNPTRKNDPLNEENQEIEEINVLIALTNTRADQISSKRYTSRKKADKGNELGQKI